MNLTATKPKKNSNLSLRELGILIAFVLLIILLTIISDGKFARPANLITIIKQTSINGILATGMMFVIISGGIDLSVGSIVAVSGVVAASFAHPGQFPLIVPILMAVLSGSILGAANGVSVAYGKIPPFIVTLGMMSAARGLALVISGGSPVFSLSKPFENIASGFFFNMVPNLAVFYLAVAALGSFVMVKTLFGRYTYAVGGNEIAARVSGINVEKMKFLIYTLSGALAGLCGLLLTSRVVSGSPTAAVGYELDAIAAVIIGGASIAGGSGKWYGAIIGVFFISVMGNGLDILNVKSHYQFIIKGLIIVCATFLDLRAKAKNN